jgi:diguanylate cyclase (GGDEF)-like protein
MWLEFRRFLDEWIGIHCETDREYRMIAERFTAIVPRMPWIYAILMVNLCGLLISVNQSITPLIAAGIALLLLLTFRLIHWARMPGRPLTQDQACNELRNVCLLGSLICAAYCLWTFALYAELGREGRNHIVLFGSLAALGCSFALSPLPFAARVPLLLLAMPLALLLISTGEIAFVGMGLTLATLILVTTRLIDAQNLTFKRLVNSRFDIEREKRRAELAERSALEERSLATNIANTDFLTGLANRRSLLSAIGRACEAQQPTTLALLDLDGFKAINDKFGHLMGDALLVEVSKRLRDMSETWGIVARLGGDEFALVLAGNSTQGARKIIEETIGRLGEPYCCDGRELVISACAGVAFALAGSRDPTEAIRMADIALFAAKREGRQRIEVFSPELEREVKRRAEIEVALRSPGVERQIDLAFQPILDLSSMKVASFEALARWRHSVLGWIPPSEFIPITEQIPVIEAISEGLLARACDEALHWPETVRLSFNLSAIHLCSSGSAERILDVVRRHNFSPSRLQIEVTETALLGDFDAARRSLAHLREAGVQLVLDDFGAGYASISYLREMQFDAIKLDGSLITAANREHGHRLLKGVLELCRAVGLPCVAEHVETEAAVGMLRELGCDFAQGYWLARPMSAESARQFTQAELIPFGPARLLKQRMAGAAERARQNH